MPTLKQKRVGGQLYELKRYDITGDDRAEYYVTADGDRFEETVYNRTEAMDLFDQVIREVKIGVERKEQMEQQDMLFGARKPRMPDFDDQDDDGGGFNIPGL